MKQVTMGITKPEMATSRGLGQNTRANLLPQIEN